MRKIFTILLCLLAGFVFSQNVADHQYQNAQRQYSQLHNNQQRETALNQMSNNASDERSSRLMLEREIEQNFKEKRKLLSHIDALNAQKSKLQLELPGLKDPKEHKENQRHLQQIEVKLSRLNRKILQNEEAFKVLHKQYTELAPE